MKLSAVFIFGLAIQLLALGTFFFTETSFLSCPDKNRINPDSQAESNHSGEASLMSPAHKSEKQDSWTWMTSFKFSDSEDKLSYETLKNEISIAAWLRYLLIASGVMTSAGLLMMISRRKKTTNFTPDQLFHLCSVRAALVPTTYQQCFKCHAIVKYQKNIKALSKGSAIWVLEITISSASDRRKSAEAIKAMNLPVIRQENNFIILGPYKNKTEAAEIVRNLYITHNVRSWLSPGN
ncbi:hypothetical protein [Pseudomonas sp. SWI44]|uniref:hypothetical protein n=1 Tax=Pseudomonas sp. SWI44 TaxID=2083053 RepID=UPI001319E962|nr:hypothetical protein [Pseudomonas sp. SWI44]